MWILSLHHWCANLQRTRDFCLHLWVVKTLKSIIFPFFIFLKCKSQTSVSSREHKGIKYFDPGLALPPPCLEPISQSFPRNFVNTKAAFLSCYYPCIPPFLCPSLVWVCHNFFDIGFKSQFAKQIWNFILPDAWLWRVILSKNSYNFIIEQSSTEEACWAHDFVTIPWCALNLA